MLLIIAVGVLARQTWMSWPASTPDASSPPASDSCHAINHRWYHCYIEPRMGADLSLARLRSATTRRSRVKPDDIDSRRDAAIARAAFKRCQARQQGYGLGNSEGIGTRGA